MSAAGRHRSAGSGMRELRPVPELRASGSKVQAARAAARRACCACVGPGCVRAGEKGVGMPRRPGTDRWLLGATLALCLIGTFMVFSASAVTAKEEYGHSIYFLVRQIAWLVLGLAGVILLMRLDYRRVRGAPAGICRVSVGFARRFP